MSERRDTSREAHWSRVYSLAISYMDQQSAAMAADDALRLFDERFVPEKPKAIRGTPRGISQ